MSPIWPAESWNPKLGKRRHRVRAETMEDAATVVLERIGGGEVRVWGTDKGPDKTKDEKWVKALKIKEVEGDGDTGEEQDGTASAVSEEDGRRSTIEHGDESPDAGAASAA